MFNYTHIYSNNGKLCTTNSISKNWKNQSEKKSNGKICKAKVDASQVVLTNTRSRGLGMTSSLFIASSRAVLTFAGVNNTVTRTGFQRQLCALIQHKNAVLSIRMNDEVKTKTPGKFAHLSMTPVTFLRVTENLQRRVSWLDSKETYPANWI